MKRLYIIIALLLIFIAIWSLGALPDNTTSTAPPDAKILHLSEKVLYAVKTENTTDSLEAELADLKMNELITGDRKSVV